MLNSSLSGLSRGLQNRQQDGGVSWNSHKAIEKPPLKKPLCVEPMLLYGFMVATHKRLCDDVQKLAAEFFSESFDGIWMGPLTAPHPTTPPVVISPTLNKEELSKVKHYLQIAHDEAEAQHDVGPEYTLYEIMKETNRLIDRINHLLVD